jgi:integrase
MAKLTKVVRKGRNGTHPVVRWQLVYFVDTLVDGEIKRVRFRRTFKTQSDGKSEQIKIEQQISSGNMPACNKQTTLIKICSIWLTHFQTLVERGIRERSTLEPYRQHINVHLKSTLFAHTPLSELNVPKCHKFLDDLFKTNSYDMVGRVRATLIQALKYAILRGYTTNNPFEGTALPAIGKRTMAPIQAPEQKDINKLIADAPAFDASGKLAAIICILATAGLRISELRGLRIIDFKNLNSTRPLIKISQRADRWGKIGPCKTKGSQRVIPIPLSTARAVQNWLNHRPDVSSDLAFPNGAGKPENYFNIRSRLWTPYLRSLKMTKLARPLRITKIKAFIGSGQFSVEGDFTSVTEQTKLDIHDLRHFYASFNIANGVNPKRLQHLMGHTLLSTTMDTYGHLWDDPEGDEVIANSLEKLFA